MVQITSCSWSVGAPFQNASSRSLGIKSTTPFVPQQHIRAPNRPGVAGRPEPCERPADMGACSSAAIALRAHPDPAPPARRPRDAASARHAAFSSARPAPALQLDACAFKLHPCPRQVEGHVQDHPDVGPQAALQSVSGGSRAQGHLPRLSCVHRPLRPRGGSSSRAGERMQPCHPLLCARSQLQRAGGGPLHRGAQVCGRGGPPGRARRLAGGGLGAGPRRKGWERRKGGNSRGGGGGGLGRGGSAARSWLPARPHAALRVQRLRTFLRSPHPRAAPRRSSRCRLRRAPSSPMVCSSSRARRPAARHQGSFPVLRRSIRRRRRGG